jgi:myosin heavy subunit
MSSSFQTPVKNNPGKGKGKKNSPSKRNAVGRSARAKAVDLVTGKTTVEYFFNPSLVLQDNSNDGMSGTGFKTPGKKDSSSSSATFSSYLLDPTMYSSRHLFVPCTIVKSLSSPTSSKQTNDENASSKDTNSGPTLVKTADGALHKIRDASQLIALTAPDDYIGMSDILNLASVTEASLLHTLRLRYKRDDIYTSAGPILISVNPYKPISFNGESLYSDKLMMEYRKKSVFEEQEPHLFQVADRAYTALMDSAHDVPHLEEEDADVMVIEDHSEDPNFSTKGQPKNQSIIISGESGAGKTEATKYIMQYLARITKKKNAPDTTLSPDGKLIAGLEDRVLSSNPLLETFGNAQTLRNDNSSRFGKFIHINFSTSTGSIVNASISNYLLEKTRITTQIEGERNYHIFYQLFAGATPELLEELGLDVGPAAFAYLGNRTSIKSDKDKDCFNETVQCLSRIGLGREEQTSVFKVAAAVLHIGNVSFEEKLDDNGEHIATISEASRPILEKACDLLGFKSDDVLDAILTKLLVVGGKTIKKASSLAIAEDKRDALAKMTYSSLFLWLVNAVNETLNEYGQGSKAHSNEKLGYIGVLDIYGFECFEVNGYEQLLINYCNEKLQRHFNRHLFEVEQKLYSAEGVDWTYISFNDNRPCLELIEGGGSTVGILNTLDDAWGGMGNANEKDGKFVNILHKLFGGNAATSKKPDDDAKTDGHEYFVTPKFGNDRQFIIVHYAGEVSRFTRGFGTCTHRIGSFRLNLFPPTIPFSFCLGPIHCRWVC